MELCPPPFDIVMMVWMADMMLILLKAGLEEFMRFCVACMGECGFFQMSCWTWARVHGCKFSAIDTCTVILTITQTDTGLIRTTTHRWTIDSMMLMAGCETAISFRLGFSIEFTAQRWCQVIFFNDFLCTLWTGCCRRCMLILTTTAAHITNNMRRCCSALLLVVVLLCLNVRTARTVGNRFFSLTMQWTITFAIRWCIVVIGLFMQIGNTFALDGRRWAHTVWMKCLIWIGRQICFAMEHRIIHISRRGQNIFSMVLVLVLLNTSRRLIWGI